MKQSETLVIKISDKYGDECLRDCVGNPNDVKRGPKGFVEIYELTEENEKQLLGKHNLVVYLGREWLASRAFNLNNISILPEVDEYICWFGIGDGGATIADPLNPTAPTNLDTDLISPVGINTTGPNLADFNSSDGKFYKLGFDSVTYEQDIENYSKYLIAKVVTTLGAGDANGEYLSEAGLFTCNSNAGGAPGPFHLFARVTFPIIIKSITRQLIFVWYIYF